MSKKLDSEKNKPLFLAQFTVWLAAGIVGIAAVAYSHLMGWAQDYYFTFLSKHVYLCTFVSPFIFIVATGLVVLYAPEAKGSGIPQVLEAIDEATAIKTETDPWATRLVSLRTAGIKIISSFAGILGGASIGREGPTVQIACSAFSWVGKYARKYFPGIDFQTYLIAGAATGVAAAFNTPLAGIAFAIEEIAEHDFVKFKRVAMLSVIIGGIISQGVSGDYLYFGHPVTGKPDSFVIVEATVIGVIGGGFGGAFAKLLSAPQLTRLPKHWLLRTFICGAISAVLSFFSRGETAGSGYEVARKGLDAIGNDAPTLLYPILKLASTVFSYLSGMAGGIFSPALSIGAGIGFTIARIAHFADLKTCALIGMVAFFSSAVQAPLTAVIIVMEMADERALILPFMVAAFLAQGLGKLIMPVPLYRFLATRKSVA